MEQVIRDIERKRKSAKTARNLELTLYCIYLPIFIIFLLINKKSILILFAIIFIVYTAISAFIDYLRRKKYKEYREILGNEYLKRYFFDRYSRMEYEEEGFTKDIVKSFAVFSNDNHHRMLRFKAQDHIKSMYHGVPFEEAYVLTDFRFKRKHILNMLFPKYDFMGRVFSISYPRLSYIDSVRISTKSIMFRSIPSMGGQYQTGNEEFDSMFNVTAINFRDANSILTPEFMRQLIGFTAKFQSVSIHICRGMVYVAIGNIPNEIDELFENPLDGYLIMLAADSYVNTTSSILNGILYILSLTLKPNGYRF